MKILTKLEEHVLLVILKLKDTAYIVSIKNALEKYLKKDISFGALYLSLNRLIREGYLKTEIGEATALQGGRAKKYYRMTRAGALKLQEIHRLQQRMWRCFDQMSKKFLENE